MIGPRGEGRFERAQFARFAPVDRGHDPALLAIGGEFGAIGIDEVDHQPPAERGGQILRHLARKDVDCIDRPGRQRAIDPKLQLARGKADLADRTPGGQRADPVEREVRLAFGHAMARRHLRQGAFLRAILGAFRQAADMDGRELR